MIYRTVWIAIAATFGIFTSQAPEFAQQYSQRLGGAIDELRVVIADFEEDARSNGMAAKEALETWGQSADSFLRDRAESMQRTFSRFDSLESQQTAFESLPEMARPVALLRTFDQRVLDGAWDDYKPAVPVTPPGLIWAGAGALFGAAIVSFFRLFGRRKRRAAV